MELEKTFVHPAAFGYHVSSNAMQCNVAFDKFYIDIHKVT